jgi:predicted AlkP superfamily pyrophosphatase or phosphodiesterase
LSKVILVLSDGLRYDTAVAGMGFLGHLVEKKLASRYKVVGELPSVSRPMYETIHTGLPASEHGIVSNLVVRRSTQPNIFLAAIEAGKKTAAAAYYWYSELYNRSPFDRIEDREVDDSSLPIQHGRFYTQDDYPDVELFATSMMLARKYNPDYLLVHPMGMDNMGEKYGAGSGEYQRQAVRQDMWLAAFIPEWLEKGYIILVTGDHGMSAFGHHGGTTPDVREVPLYLMGKNLVGKGETNEVVSQLQIAPTICRLLDIKIPNSMKQSPVI